MGFHRDVYRTLVKGLMRQKDSGQFCDVKLCINGHYYFAHKAVLASASPYFYSMFTSHMKEQSSTVIDLTESLLLENDDSFRQIVDFMYCGEIDITTENAEDTLRIADFLLLEDVKEYCRQFYIQYGNLNLSNCVCVSVLAEHHNVPEVAHVATAMVKARFHDYLIHSEEILDVPESCFCKMLTDSDITQFTSNDNLVKVILRWVNHDKEDRQKRLLSMLASVYLQSLSSEMVSILLEEPDVKSNSKLVVRLEDIQHDETCIRLAQELTPHLNLPQEEKSCIRISGKPVLIATNCHPGFHYIKVLVYSIKEEKWYSVPINNDAIMNALPPRLSMCNICLHDTSLYMFLCHNLPYPSDMLRVYVMALCIKTGKHTLYTFHHYSNQSQCCQTTLTDDRAVPPVMVYCRGFLCIIGNMEGTGQLFLCDLATQTYMCYQVPGIRFISLARAVVKDDRYVFIWCRHRFGHEEYCINKDVTFIRFDCKNKKFNISVIPAPPQISYGEFGDPHVHMLTLEGESIIIHSPGRPSLILDETTNKWATFHRKVPSYPIQHTPLDMPYHGYEVYTSSGKDIFVLQNPAPYTTSMVCLQESSLTSVNHPPPPVDCISLLTAGNLDACILHSMFPCDQFDATYTRLVYNCTSTVDYDTEESDTTHSLSDSDNEYEFDGYEYDDDIYGYYEDYDY